MPIHAKYYAWAIIATGAAAAAAAAALWTCQSPTRFLACLCLALLGATFKVKLPGMEGCISPSFVPMLYAVGTMGWQETVVMAAAAGIMQSLWRTSQPVKPIQILFNGANLAIAIGAGFAIGHSIAPDQILAQLGVAVVVFEVLNTLSVSTIVCLVTGSPLRSIWNNCHLWTFPYHLGGALLACVWTQSDVALSLSVSVLAAATLYLMSAFYQELVGRVGVRAS